MRILFLLFILLLSFSPLCYGREIFEGGYSGSYAKDGYQPDTTVDVFTGEAKMTQRQKEQVYSAVAFSENNAAEEQAVYLGPISEIIATQAERSADDSSISANTDQNNETDGSVEKSEEGE
jgi:hypothetical protein